MPTEQPEPNTDVTLATEVSEGMPGALGDGNASTGSVLRPEEDRTVFADPVEQAILVDRTRRARGSARGPAPPAPAAMTEGGDATSVTTVGDTAVDVPSAPDEDAVFGNYRVVAPLVAGGGLHFLAEHSTLGFPVAIKLLQPALIGSPEAENRFFSEAMVASRIAHPGVPMVLDFGYDQRGIAFLATEYLEGETLAAHLDGGSTFSLQQLLEIGAQVAGIATAAHACGVLHGDIRSENVHICPDASEPSGLRIKLLDFGSDREGGDRALGAQDARADIHGLGCVLYRLLAGRPVFTGTAEEVERAWRTQEPPPPSVHRADIPVPIDTLVHRMVARRPKERPGSMAEVERELRTLLVGQHLLAAASPPPPGPLRWGQSFQPTWQSLRRWWWLSAWPAARERARQASSAVRRAALRHPRLSVALIAAVLFAGAIGLVLLVA
jgi:Protein kinase domain